MDYNSENRISGMIALSIVIVIGLLIVLADGIRSGHDAIRKEIHDLKLEIKANHVRDSLNAK